MRHVRILGLCLAAVFAITATTLVVASPAFAKCDEECKKEKEEAKEQKEREKNKKLEEKTHPWQGHFGECPFEYREPEGGKPLSGCIWGEAGKESFFQAGNVTVHFKLPIVLRGGVQDKPPLYHPLECGAGTEKEVVNCSTKTFIEALDGNSISREAEPAPSLTEGVDAELLPEPEKKRYEEYVASGKSTKVTATVELAGPASGIHVNLGAELEETPESYSPAFVFPVMIHLTNKFLGEDCYIGSNLQPVVVPFISGETSPPPPNVPIHGYAGVVRTPGEGAVAETVGARLVNNSYAAPGVHGCGVGGDADAAINQALGLPSPAGSNTTELIGNFAVVSRVFAEEGLAGEDPWYG